MPQSSQPTKPNTDASGRSSEILRSGHVAVKWTFKETIHDLTGKVINLNGGPVWLIDDERMSQEQLSVLEELRRTIDRSDLWNLGSRATRYWIEKYLTVPDQRGDITRFFETRLQEQVTNIMSQNPKWETLLKVQHFTTATDAEFAQLQAEEKERRSRGPDITVVQLPAAASQQVYVPSLPPPNFEPRPWIPPNTVSKMYEEMYKPEDSDC